MFESVTSFKGSRRALSSTRLKKAVKVAKAQDKVWSEVARHQDALSDNIGSDVRSSLSGSSLQLTLAGEQVGKATKGHVEALAKIDPEMGELAETGREHLVAGNERVGDRGFPAAGAR